MLKKNLVANRNTYTKVRNTIKVVTVCFQGKNLKDARDNAKRVDLLKTVALLLRGWCPHVLLLPGGFFFSPT